MAEHKVAAVERMVDCRVTGVAKGRKVRAAEHKAAGMVEYRAAEVVECRATGMAEHRAVRVVGHKAAGMAEHRLAGVAQCGMVEQQEVECRVAGVMKCRGVRQQEQQSAGMKWSVEHWGGG